MCYKFSGTFEYHIEPLVKWVIRTSMNILRLRANYDQINHLVKKQCRLDGLYQGKSQVWYNTHKQQIVDYQGKLDVYVSGLVV